MSNEIAQYGDFTIEAAEEEFEASKKSSTSKMLSKLKEGKTVLRFLPPRVGCTTPFRVVHEHYVDMPGVGNVRFVCPRLEAKRPCPACTQAAKWAASANTVDQEKGKKFQPRRRIYANVIDRSAPEAGPKIFGFGKDVHEQLIELRKELEVNFVHPATGVDVFVMRHGTGQFDTEYKVVLDPRGATPLHPDATIMADWLASMHDLEQQARVDSEEDLQARLSGQRPRGGQSGALPPGRTAEGMAFGNRNG